MKRQRRLETFFQSQREELTFFHVDWHSETPRAQWLSERPQQTNFQEEVQWREMKQFVTIGSAMAPGKEAAPAAAANLDTALTAIIKSNLQKCIRRKLRENAMETAKLFIEADLTQFVRRLLIIMLEDVMIHESLPVIVWLTAALNKGFVVNDAILSWLLSVVDYLCREPNETYHSCQISNVKREDDEKMMYQDALKHPQRDILLSLLFRKSYGGMPGDMAMISSYVHLLLAGKGGISTTPLSRVSFNDIKLLKLENVTLCAIDFHCYPQLVMVLARENPALSAKDIRAAIWHFNSKINGRVRCEDDEALKKIWQRLQRRVWSLQKTYLSQCINTFTWHAAQNGLRQNK